MTQNKKKTLIILAGVGFLVAACVTVFVMAISIRGTVVGMFGKPVDSLTAVQKIVFPIELYLNRETLTRPADPTALEKDFVVMSGESVSMICIRLEQEMLIEDAESMRIYLIYTGLDRQMKSGGFRLSAGMTPLEIAAVMLDATPQDAVFTILPGWRLEEVAVVVSTDYSGLPFSAETFLAAAKAPAPSYFDYLPIESAPTLEGFLFPKDYKVPRESDIETVLSLMLMSFNDQIDQNMLDGFQRQGLSFYDAIILASIIEKEAVVEDEKPMIASVFYNRLAQGMRLETDPTVQYALGYQLDTGLWWKSPLSLDDLSVESPYNTYRIDGLPPTPISNPSLSSIRAVAYPAETPYFYFRAACDGSGRHNFAITYEEHLENACE